MWCFVRFWGFDFFFESAPGSGKVCCCFVLWFADDKVCSSEVCLDPFFMMMINMGFVCLLMKIIDDDYMF
jgi:hypothetical protein